MLSTGGDPPARGGGGGAADYLLKEDTPRTGR